MHGPGSIPGVSDVVSWRDVSFQFRNDCGAESWQSRARQRRLQAEARGGVVWCALNHAACGRCAPHGWAQSDHS